MRPRHRGEGLVHETLPCSCAADKPAEVLPSESRAEAMLQERVGGVEAAPHDTSDVDGGVACDASVVAVLSHGEQEGYGEGPGVGGSRSWLQCSQGSLARIVDSSESPRAAETGALHDRRRSRWLPSTIAGGVSSDEASVEWLEPP